MGSQPGSHRANIIINLSDERFQDTVTAALNYQVQTVIADLEEAYHSLGLDTPQAHGVQVIVSTNYNIRLLDTQADLNHQMAGRNRANTVQELTRSDADALLETNLLNFATDGPEDFTQLDSATDGPADENDQDLTEAHPDDENDQDLTEAHTDEQPSSIPPALVVTFLQTLPLVDPADLEDESRDCPVCREPFSPTSDRDHPDGPKLLPCNYVIGSACIEEWVSRGHNSCPLCRAPVLDPDLLITVDEYLHGATDEEADTASSVPRHVTQQSLDDQDEIIMTALERRNAELDVRMARIAAGPQTLEAGVALAALDRDNAALGVQVAALRMRMERERH